LRGESVIRADDIATHPEIGFEEKRSIGKLIDYLRQHNFSVETGTAGLSTAFDPKNSKERTAKARFDLPNEDLKLVSVWSLLFGHYL